MRDPNTEDAIARELGGHGGHPSCDTFNYSMKRAAQSFFPVWDQDGCYCMFDKCCDLFRLNQEQRIIVRECMEKHGMIDHCGVKDDDK